MEEKWKPVFGLEELYEVSSFGRVRTVRYRKGGHRKGYILKPKVMRDGYLYFRFTLNKKQIFRNAHRVVAMHFIENPKDKKEVNHKDCDKKNNRIDNLEWVTPKENVDHAVRMGRYKINRKGRTVKIAICHPPLYAVGIKNQCKSCYMKDYRKVKKMV